MAKEFATWLTLWRHSLSPPARKPFYFLHINPTGIQFSQLFSKKYEFAIELLRRHTISPFNSENSQWVKQSVSMVGTMSTSFFLVSWCSASFFKEIFDEALFWLSKMRFQEVKTSAAVEIDCQNEILLPFNTDQK